METAPRLILLGSWALFILFWVVMAFGAKTDVQKQSIDDREKYSIPFTASIACLAIAQHAPLGLEDGVRFMFARLVPLTQGLGWASALVAVAGAILAVWARVALGRNWSPMVALKDGHELVTSGPYALIRHPIYTALLLLMLASTMANRTAFALVSFALMTLSCWIKLRAEEEMMLGRFPYAYPAYMKRTKRLVPWIV